MRFHYKSQCYVCDKCSWSCRNYPWVVKYILSVVSLKGTTEAIVVILVLPEKIEYTRVSLLDGITEKWFHNSEIKAMVKQVAE